MPNLLFVSYSGLFGGAERTLIDCTGALDGDHMLACPDGPLLEQARARGLRVLAIPERSLRLRGGLGDRARAAARVAAHARELAALGRDLNPDLVAVWGMRSAIAAALALRTPFALSLPDFLPGRFVGTTVRAAAARASVVMVCSQAVAEDLDPRGRLGDRLRVVYPGVDTSAFDGPAAPADPRSPPEVIVLGALADWKRPDLALEIAARAAPAVPGLRVRLLGGPITADDPLPARLRARAAQPDLAGTVELAGIQPDPRPDLWRATCLLHCAPREPFGIALLEALAAGRPVVAPDSAGPREIVDRSCGVLYQPGDAAAGAAALRELLRDPVRARAMGEAGRVRVRTRFGLSHSRAAFADAVRPLVRPRAASSALAPERLTVVTVTHNSERELQALIESLERHIRGVRLIVVDCDSSDASVAVARPQASATVIELGQNLGFGRGCNRGIQEVRAPVTALVNPDVELIDDSLLELAFEAERSDRPERLLAPLVLNADGTRQDSVHPAPGSVADLICAVVPPVLVPGPALAPWRSSGPRQVGWAVGAALLARTETLRRLGPFDESIFMYGEDLELALRAHTSGVATWFWPSARVIHHRAHSTTVAYGGEPFELLARARHDAVSRRLGPRRALVDERAQALTFASRIALKLALGRPAGRERRQLAAVRALRPPHRWGATAR